MSKREAKKFMTNSNVLDKKGAFFGHSLIMKICDYAA